MVSETVQHECLPLQVILMLPVHVHVLSVSYIRVLYFRFLISEFLYQAGQEICFLKTEFSYKRVSYLRVFVIHNKEEFGRGKKIRWQ